MRWHSSSRGPVQQQRALLGELDPQAQQVAILELAHGHHGGDVGFEEGLRQVRQTQRAQPRAHWLGHVARTQAESPSAKNLLQTHSIDPGLMPISSYLLLLYPSDSRRLRTSMARFLNIAASDVSPRTDAKNSEYANSA